MIRGARGCRVILGVYASLSMLSCSSARVITPTVHAPLQQTWGDMPQDITLSATPSAPQAWWHVFHDSTLDWLMLQGLSQNLDLRSAQARVAQARATHQAVRATLFPQISGSFTDQTNHLPLALAPPGTPATELEAALVASWNVDLFGAQRNQTRAAAAQLRATQFDYDATKINLLSEIASSYLQYRLFQLQYVISQRSAVSQAETVRITQARFDQGAASRLDLERVVSQLAITRAAVPQAFEEAESERANLIALLATTPEDFVNNLPSPIPDDPQVPSGDPIAVLMTPAQIIEYRPDIQSARQQLIAASANLKSSLAQRYPQITLGALFGSAAGAVGEVLHTSTGAWGYSAGVTLPLLDFGRIRAAINVADAQQLQAYLNYEQTVRAALKAMQTAIVLYAQGVLRERQLVTALESSRTAARLARVQYQAGALALLDVLDAERTAYDTELTWSQAHAAVAERLVVLFQTMGILPPA
jgi:outer membrane protein, multidrug efflux system